MSLLLNTSLVVTPTVYNQGTLFGIVPTDPSSNNADFTVTRATTKTRTNSIGLIETVAINAPSIDYSLGSCPNILLEPQRTNIALRSEEFDNASWTKNQSTLTPNTTIAPDGTLTADTLTANGLNSNYRLSQNLSLLTTTTYTYSIYAKKDTNNFIQLYGNSSILGTDVWANFDLNAGVVGTTGSLTTATITNAGNDWYRCTMTGATIAAGSSLAFVLQFVNSATAVRAQSNTLATSVFLWGAQLEAGAYATSYIPTTTASVTRNLDNITRSNVFTNGLITAAGGTWFVEIRNNVAVVRDLSTSGIFLNTGVVSTIGNGIVLRNPGVSVSRIGIFTVVGGALSSNLYTIPTDNAKIAFKWNGTTVDIFVNGVKVVNAASFTPTAMQNLIAEGSNRAVYVNEMALFPTPLTDTQCIALTTL